MAHIKTGQFEHALCLLLDYAAVDSEKDLSEFQLYSLNLSELDMASEELQPHLFTGRWIGETQGYVMPAHIWEITQHALGFLMVSTRWEGQTEVAAFSAKLVPNELAFIISGSKTFKATLVDKQHFVIPGWCTNDVRGGIGPAYDVVFSRPGIAELTGRQAYAQYLEHNVQVKN